MTGLQFERHVRLIPCFNKMTFRQLSKAAWWTTTSMQQQLTDRADHLCIHLIVGVQQGSKFRPFFSSILMLCNSIFNMMMTPPLLSQAKLPELILDKEYHKENLALYLFNPYGKNHSNQKQPLENFIDNFKKSLQWNICWWYHHIS